MIRRSPALSLAVAAALATAYSLSGHGETMPSQTAPTAVTPIADRDRWNLSELYATDAAWRQSHAAFEKKIDGMTRHRGRLG